MARYHQNRAGLERARKHIEEAKALSKELGGTDKDVKAYFFSLSKAQLDGVLTAYGKKYTPDKEAYARETYPLWKSGRRQMSGLVMERLFSLLPSRMPLKQKYALAKSLWDHVAPETHVTLLAGPSVDPQELANRATSILDLAITNHSFPDELERRFRWLSSGDIDVMRQLQAMIKDHEREVLKGLSLSEIRAFVELFGRSLSDGNSVHLTHTMKVGRFHCHIDLKEGTEGITEREGRPRTPPTVAASSFDWSQLIWWAIGAFFLFSVLSS